MEYFPVKIHISHIYKKIIATEELRLKDENLNNMRLCIDLIYSV